MPFDEGTKRQVIMLRFILVLLLMMVAVVSKATLEDVIEEDVRSLREGLLQKRLQSKDYLLRVLDLISSQSQKINKLRAEQAQEMKKMADEFKILLENSEFTIKTQAKEMDKLRKDLSEMSKEGRKDVSKRIVLHSDADILRLVTALQNDLSKLKATKGSGSTYVRWGRKSCPNINGTELVYSGYAGGSWYGDSGAASNYICLAPDPQWDHYSDAHDAGAHVYGAEYQFGEFGIPGVAQFMGGNSVYQEDVPCSVCRSSRPTTIMIPGRTQCYIGWTMEYKGYLTAGHSAYSAATEFVCLDDRPDNLPGGHPNENGALFYFVEGRCGSLPCPPYIDGRELTCVVCTK